MVGARFVVFRFVLVVIDNDSEATLMNGGKIGKNICNLTQSVNSC